MKRKISFYKEGNEWYADVPLIPKANNLMVAGADIFLNQISQGSKRVTLTITTKLEDVFKCRFYLVRIKHNAIGGTYMYRTPSDFADYEKTLWLCNVTHFVLGRHPKFIYILDIDRHITK